MTVDYPLPAITDIHGKRTPGGEWFAEPQNRGGLNHYESQNHPIPEYSSDYVIINGQHFAFASDISNNENQAVGSPEFNIALGNVPSEYTPNSVLTFDSKGNFVVAYPEISAAESENSSAGVEVGEET